ncbi:MAG: winged helix-turn-helix transcriptional regulator [Verrucomicrobiales bacterium]|nr:winged helix-turn-helix transcriptional regulator [Verrucomicrobiales bacterium]
MAARKKPTDPLRDCVPMLRALADPARMDIVRALAAGPRAVSALAAETGLTLYTTSRHLKMLKDAGLAEMKAIAQQRIYSLSSGITDALARNHGVLELGCCSFRLGGG